MPEHDDALREPDRIRSLPILIIGFGFLAFAGIWVALLLYYYFSVVGPGLYVPPRRFAQPQLQTQPLSDLERLETAQRARIERYGWIDRSKGIVSVPIGRAMQIVASKGASAWAPLAQPSASQKSAAQVAGEAMKAIQAPPQVGGAQ